MNVGILIGGGQEGGVFQHALSIIESLAMYLRRFNYYIISYDTGSLKWLVDENLGDINLLFISPKENSLRNRIRQLARVALKQSVLRIPENEERVQPLYDSIQLLVIPFPSLFGFRNRIRYIVSIPDLMHKYYPGFPEYPLRERIKRDLVYRCAVRHSVLTVVDSKQGMNDLNSFFRIEKEKIRIVPYIPPGYVYKHKNMESKTAETILSKYKLPERFVFYPAQYWYHKNHMRLINALKRIRTTFGVKIPLVTVGSPKGNFQGIMKLIRKLKMEDQVVRLGYVSDIEVVALYKKSIALIFPSLFGPTNIPPLEAMVLGTPVVCSNLFSMAEQVGDAGLLFDPFSAEDLAAKVHRIWIDRDLRIELIQKGYERVKNMTLQEYAKQWEKVIEDALVRG